MNISQRLPARSGFLPQQGQESYVIGWNHKEKKFVWNTHCRHFDNSVSVVHPTPQFTALLDRYVKQCRYYRVSDVLPSFCDLATELVRSLEQSVLFWPDEA